MSCDQVRSNNSTHENVDILVSYSLLKNDLETQLKKIISLSLGNI